MSHYSPQEVKESIEKFINTSGLKIKDFCKLIDISRPTYYKLVSGKNVWIKTETVEKLQEHGVLS